MRPVGSLAGRNLRVYARDRAGVFFSLLASLILLMLYVLFLGNLQRQSLASAYPDASSDAVAHFVDAWVFAGIIAVTPVTTSLAALSAFVQDRGVRRFDDFLVSPAPRTSLVAGYLASTVTISVVMSVVVVAICDLYLAVADASALPFGDLARVVGFVVVISLTFSAIASFVVTFVRSATSFSVLSTIIGTLVGFLAGAYVPVGQLPNGVVHVMNLLPFAPSAAIVRQAVTQAPLDALAGGDPHATSTLSTMYGISPTLGGSEVSTGAVVIVLLVVTVVFGLLATWRLRRTLA